MRSDGLILALNSGSSSLKFGVFRRGERDEVSVLTGSAAGIGRDNGSLRIFGAGGAAIVQKDCVHESQGEAFELLASSILKDAPEMPVAIGHRIVHGGPQLRSHQLITSTVKLQLSAAKHFAPIHIPEALRLVAMAESSFGSAQQFACFDDAFHQTLPEVAYRIPIAAKWLDAGIRRYGFHGLSYAALVHHFGQDLPPRAVFAHLGSGSSVCAVRDGRSIDTTMSFTPTGGIPTSTRSGDLDPEILLFLLRHSGATVDDVERMLNCESGLQAISEGDSDVEALERRASAGDSRATLALEVFANAVRKSIGAYVALLGGVDKVVFTGGIGEHSSHVRCLATRGLECIGITPDKVNVVHADEERQIARHCRALMEEHDQR